ncbi:hypothetical protein Leryth_001009 [Lithospermum erythrorhizon]|nr:hypothetical protein Leryth_001009 [Lithospermum erythrorhizon]
MEDNFIDEISEKAKLLQNIVSKNQLNSCVSKLSLSARGIPHGKDFHFYNNFDDCMSNVLIVDENAEKIIKKIGEASELWPGRDLGFGVECSEMDVEGDEWLVNVNDEVFELIDSSIDEFKDVRKKGEESGVGVRGDDGFKVVCGKRGRRGGEGEGSGSGVRRSEEGGVKVQVATKVKQKIPFHIPTLKKPQDEYKIIVNNVNKPFEHVLLEKCEDGRRIHPLEKFSASDFVDGDETKIEPVEPPPLERTPFKFIEEVKDLKALAAKLRKVDEFAVDLEHNQYRSFQGLTCLMQISTRSEDFVIDTLKLKVQIGPYLREFFKDPTKRKVLHGADHDVLWLQRDFGIYICNMFDTGQASRVMNLERFSLEYLLNHFCGVKANKEYQNADWRLRPLPPIMLRYAREDTHYLLYIYDLMRLRLRSLAADAQCPGTSLSEVYNRSYNICMSLYEKELLTDQSFRSIYAVRGAGLSAQQLAVVAGLCEWRDIVARAEDESTGFILPNRTLVEIATEMPLTTSKLRRFVRSKHSYVERNLASIVNVIRCSMRNSAAFEAAAEELKAVPKVVPEPEHKSETIENHEALSEVDNIETSISPRLYSYSEQDPTKESPDSLDENENIETEIDVYNASALKHEGSKERESTPISPIIAGASVEVLKKPSRTFGALLGNSLKRKLRPDKREPEQMKLEHIKSEVSLPFHHFKTTKEQVQENMDCSAKKSEFQLKLSHPKEPTPAVEEPASLEVSLCEEAERTSGRPSSPLIVSHPEEPTPATQEPALLMEFPLCEEPACASEGPDMQPELSLREEPVPATSSKMEEVISLDSDDEPSPNSIAILAENGMEQMEDNGGASEEFDEEDDAMSISHMASNFQECFQSIKETRYDYGQKSRDHESHAPLKPFDYETARKQVKYGEVSTGSSRGRKADEIRGKIGQGHRNGGSAISQNDEVTQDLPQGKRRQAFPASGNRSASFR